MIFPVGWAENRFSNLLFLIALFLSATAGFCDEERKTKGVNSEVDALYIDKVVKCTVQKGEGQSADIFPMIFPEGLPVTDEYREKENNQTVKGLALMAAFSAMNVLTINYEPEEAGTEEDAGKKIKHQEDVELVPLWKAIYGDGASHSLRFAPQALGAIVFGAEQPDEDESGNVNMDDVSFSWPLQRLLCCA